MDNITIFDVAKKAGVSKSTVSRVINNKKNVNEKTRQKILQVIDELDFQPSNSARSLVTKKTRNIGLILPDLGDCFFAKFTKGAEEICRSNNYNLLMISSYWDVKAEQDRIDILHNNRMDGLLLVSGSSISRSYINQLENKNLPIVVIDRLLPNTKIPTVNPDNFHGAYTGLKHLIKLGHEKISCVQGPGDLYSVQERIRGYRTAVTEKNPHFNPQKYIFQGQFDRESGYKAARKIIKTRPRSTAVFFTNDRMAVGGMEAFKEANIKIPEDISILGCDDLDYVSLLSPPLTTLEQPREKMGQKGISILMDIIENSRENKKQKKEKDWSFKFEMKLKIRGSTGPVPSR